MKQAVAANKVGNMIVPNHPMYRRLSVLVIQLEKRSHTTAASAFSFLVSRGANELAIFKSTKLSILVPVVAVSFGAKFNADDEKPVLWFVATFGMVKAEDEEVEAKRRNNLNAFMVFVAAYLRLTSNLDL